MKRILVILSVLVMLSPACATLTGGGNGDNPVGDAVQVDELSEESGSNISNDAVGAEDVEETPDETGGGGTVGSSQGCDNLFYPLGKGYAYTYRITFDDGSDPEEYQFRTLDETEETVTVELDFDEFSSEVQWQCGEEGMFSSEYAQFDFQDFGEFVEIETVSFEGVTLPPEEEWYLGNTWDMNYEINIDYELEGAALFSNVVGDMVYEIVAVEEVTVPVDTYPEAYVVKTTGTIIFNTDLMGTGMSNEFPLELTSWYVKDIGMVKQISTDIGGTSTTELVSLE